MPSIKWVKTISGDAIGPASVDRRPIDRVAARGIAAVGPVQDAVCMIELQIDRLRQVVAEHFDIGPVLGGLALRDVDIRTKDAAESRVVGTFLRPVDLPALRDPP